MGAIFNINEWLNVTKIAGNPQSSDFLFVLKLIID